MIKICSKCNIEKDEKEFRKHAGNTCYACERKYYKEHYAKNGRKRSNCYFDTPAPNKKVLSSYEIDKKTSHRGDEVISPSKFDTGEKIRKEIV
jgi:hypothetical protein